MTSLLGIHSITKHFGTELLFKNISFTISAGDRIGLFGPNGSGKSTLLKILAEEENPDEGNLSRKQFLKLGYASQSPEFGNLPLLEILLQNTPAKEKEDLLIRAQVLLGKAQFENFDILGSCLSGGWKKRLSIVQALLHEPDLLLLDEPTNHLDFISENILIQALQQYKGSFVVVSHNRHFVSQIANKIWYIEDKQIKEYPGTYDEYEYWRTQNEASEVKVELPKPKKTVEVQKPQTPSQEAKRKSLERELKKVEEQLDTFEKQKAAIEAEMIKPEVSNDFNLLQQLQNDLINVQTSINDVTKKWEEVALAIDES